MRRTKIVCTIGPASEDQDIIASLVQHGMDVARLNFSHGKIEEHLDYFEQDTLKTVTGTISYATCRAAMELNAAAIISSTQSGYTARMVSKFKPRAPIIAVTLNEKVASSLTPYMGSLPSLVTACRTGR